MRRRRFLAASLSTLSLAGAIAACLLVSFPARAAEVAPTLIEIETKFIDLADSLAKELPVLNLQKPIEAGDPAKGTKALKFEVRTTVIGEQRRDQFLQALNGQKGVDILSAPRVTAKSQQQATVEVIREFRYPTEWAPPDEKTNHFTPKTFVTQNVGVTLKTEATVNEEEGTIAVHLQPEVVDFLGLVDFVTKKPVAQKKTEGGETAESNESDRTEPVFETRKGASAVTVRSGQSVLMVLEGVEIAAPFASPHAGKTTVVLVTVRRTSSGPPPEVKQVPPAAVAPPGASFAIPVEGKPGFVRSPFAVDAGFIDVRGFPAGTEVKDPYTGKVFRVP